jgi:hypothetical protein
VTDPRYPIGKFEWPQTITEADRKQWITTLAELPAALRKAVAGMTDAQLNTPYREGGWTVRELIHHIADSHMNSYVRFKLGLSEHEPTIKTYDEAAWAQLRDAALIPAETSLCLLECLHLRWVCVLDGMRNSDWQRNVIHPELGTIRLDSLLALYDWHSRHHTAHITSLRQNKGW